MEEGVRIDKWLWSIRVFKTRSQATEACRSGKVHIGDIPVKPSREVKTGDMISIKVDSLNRLIKVSGLTSQRLGPKRVTEFMEDLTPPEEYQNRHLRKQGGFGHRLRGLGRPTKKDRREIEILKKYLGA